MTTWKAMLCCQCGHPTAPMPYPYQWMTTCHVCSHKACLACNFGAPVGPDSSLYLNQGQQVPRLESTTWDANNIRDLTEAGISRAENGGRSNLEIQEILGNGQIGGYECEDLQAPLDLGEYEDFLDFIKSPAPQVLPPFQEQFSESSPRVSSIHSAPRETRHLNNNTDFFSSETHVGMIEGQIARMPRNLESEVLETWAWMDRFYPLATGNGEEMPEILADEPLFRPEETLEPDARFPLQ
jgi:hypothetical protein